MKTINCPSCGADVQLKIKHCKLLSCDYCGCPLLLEDDSVKNIGEQSSLTEVPSILKLGENFQYREHRFTPFGCIQYDYGDGLWLEWWVMTAKQQGLWISVDEGEIALQTAFEAAQETRDKLADYTQFQLGDYITIAGNYYKVTEKNSATCIGIEGQLPKLVLAGDTMKYIDLSAPKSSLLTVEYNKHGINLFKGTWIDPFELKAL